METIRAEREYNAKQIFNNDIEVKGSIIGGMSRVIGKEIYMDPVNGNDGWKGRDRKHPKKTLTAAYAELDENKMDTLFITGGASALALTDLFTWAKDYCRVIGVTPPIATGGRVRITNSVIDETAGEFVISGTGNQFYNMHWQYGASATATSVIGVSITDGRNYFGNCHFEGPIDATIGAASYRTLQLGAGVQDCTFEGCSFGQRTILATGAAGATVFFTGGNITNNVFRKCIFNAYNSNTASCTIGFANNAMPDSGFTLFDDCTFINHVNVNIADVIRFTTGAHGVVALKNCGLVGLGTLVWATNNKTTIFSTGAAGAATGGVGANPA